jgi:hypothetical protein
MFKIRTQIKGRIEKTGIWAIFSCFFDAKFFFKNDPIRANFMRGIDCAHFQRFPDPESGSRSVCIEAKIENFKIFFLKVTFWG